MASNAVFAEIAALAGDPARAGMLHALMDGRALSASELARVAGIASDLGTTRPKLFVGPRDAAMRAARTCYDHLAGRLGVALADALIAGGHAEFASDGGVITDSGVALLGRVGIDIPTLRERRGRRAVRILCRPCLDWSERRPHLAGSLGAEICGQSFAQGWIRRIDGTRAVAITPKGYRVFREQFGAQLG